jgi:hypothetical protein
VRKLAIYFLSQDSQSRILDAEQQPHHGAVEGWIVGRAAGSDVAFPITRNPDYGMVSKVHAVISASLATDATEGGTPLYIWEITDWGDGGQGSTNGTYLAKDGRRPYRLQSGIHYALAEGDRLQFGCRAAAVKVSFDIDDTMSPDFAAIEDDGPPTGVPTTPPVVRAKPRSDSPWFVPDILEPGWQWFLAKNSAEQFVFLLTGGGVAALIIYVLKL